MSNQVTEVSIKKKGIGKNGKAYTMYAVVLDDGTQASGFESVRVGENVSVVRQGKYLNYIKDNEYEQRMPRSDDEQDWPDEPPQKAPAIAPQAPPPRQSEEDGVEATRRHLMQSANLYNLCVACANTVIAPHMPEIAHTSEQFQAIVGCIYIEASGRRTNDGVNWWSYIDKMPTHPIKK